MALTKVTGDFIKDGVLTVGHLHTSHGITTAHIGEGSNLYFTNARVDARIGDLSTSNLSEGTNLYYTDARVASYLTTNSYATQSYVNTQVSNLVDSAPSTLDTLNELAAALGDDANFSTTVTNSIATKMPLAGGTFTGQVIFPSAATTKPVLPNGFISRNDLDDTSGRHDIWGISERYYPSNSTAGDAWGIQWSGTPNDIVFVGGGTDRFTVSLDEGNITAGGTITASGGNSTQWNTAYGWGNHADAGYLASSSYTASDVLSKILTVDGSGSGLDADLLDGIDSASFVRSDADDTLSGQYTFTKTNDHAIKVGTIRGTAVGSQTGEFIQMYNRVNIGGPSGWGASNTATPTYGLSTYGGTRLSVYTDYTESGGSMRAPLFYDSNNTGYYVDPASTSKFNILEINNGASTNQKIEFKDTQTSGYAALRFFYNSSEQNTIHAFGSTWSSSVWPGNSAGAINLSAYNGITIGVWNSPGAWVYNSGQAQFQDSVRSPIFYDSNNTGRYIDPASSSRIDQLEIANTSNQENPGSRMKIGSDGFIFGGNNDGYESNSAQISAGYHTANSLNFVGMGTTSTVRRMDFWAEGGFHVSGNIYDKDNTAYYVDPAGTSIVNVLQAGGTSGSWGSAKIATNTSSGWGTSSSLPWIGSGPGSTGSLIMIHNPHIPFRTDNARSGASGRAGLRCAIDTSASNWWDIGLIGDEFEIYRNASGTQLFRVTNGGNAIASGNMQAPIFYDSNSTTYYFNGADTSVSAQVAGPIVSKGPTSGTTAANRAFQVNTTTKGALHSDAAAGGTSGSADTAPLVTFSGSSVGSVHGGIYGSQNSSTGTSLGFFTTDSYATGPKQSLTIEDTGNVYVNRGLLQASTSVRGPIFYDSDNTNRYINPAGASVLYTIQSTSAQASPRWDTAFYVLQAQHWYGDNSTQEMFVGESGNTINVRGTIKAPIFYDSNDTGKYVDPNGTSVVNKLNATSGNTSGTGAPGYAGGAIEIVTSGNIVPAIGFHRGGYSATTLYEYDGELYVNAWTTRAQTGKLLSSGNWSSYVFSGSWNGSNFPGSRWGGFSVNGGEIVFQRDNPSTGKMSVMVDGNFYAGENGGFWSIWSGNNYNNRIGIYGDSSGNLQIGTSASENVLRTNYGYVQVGPMNSSHAHLYTDRSNFYFNKQIQLLGGTLINQNDVQAVIYYDRSDTSKYCDPNGVSQFSGLTVANRISGTIDGVGISGYGNNSISFQQTSGSFAGRSGWHNHIICNHGNGASYYNTIISMDFFGNTLYHSRLQGGTFNGPYQICSAGAGFTSGQEINSSLRMKAAEFWDYNNTNYYAHLDATGYSIRIAGTVQSNYSDIQLKDVIENIPNALDKVNQLNGFYYYPNEIAQGYGYKKKKEVGLSAQDVEAVLPEIVDKAPVSDKYKTIQYERVVPLLVEAIKELKANNDSLRARIETLENQ